MKKISLARRETYNRKHKEECRLPSVPQIGITETKVMIKIKRLHSVA
jgi:hypothetical protein